MGRVLQQFARLAGRSADKQGAGLRILTETVSSPSTADLLKTIKTLYPQSKWHQWEPAGAHSARAGAMQAFGSAAETHYNFLNANVVVSLDSDFLAAGLPGCATPASSPPSGALWADQKTMNRLYMVEPKPTPTGSKADHRFPMRASEVESFAFSLAGAIGRRRNGGGANRDSSAPGSPPSPAISRQIRAQASSLPATSNRRPCTLWRMP